MFSLNNLIRRKNRHNLAHDHGWNDAWLGLPNQNPYPVDSVAFKEYNWGWQEASDLLDEYNNTAIYSPGHWENYI